LPSTIRGETLVVRCSTVLPLRGGENGDRWSVSFLLSFCLGTGPQ
jgi:hypothetical protein